MTAQWLWHSSAEHVVVDLTPGYSGCIPNKAELQKMLMYRAWGDTFKEPQAVKINMELYTAVSIMHSRCNCRCTALLGSVSRIIIYKTLGYYLNLCSK